MTGSHRGAWKADPWKLVLDMLATALLTFMGGLLLAAGAWMAALTVFLFAALFVGAALVRR